jgi:drug/metabolite transporter (DMT)-like permease
MTASSRLQSKTYVLLAICILAGPFGNAMLGRGMKHFDGASVSLQTGIAIFSSPTIWLGIASLITFFVSYSVVLSWADYSFVQPASALSYLVVALLSWKLLGESISPMHWAGILVICLGVATVAGTSASTTGPAPDAPEIPVFDRRRTS